jgi:hypothetical protein
VKKKVIIPVVIAVIVIIAVVVVCAPETHYSIAEIKTQGWPADKVSIDVAKISPFGGGVSYSETNKQYAFFIYDKTAMYTGGTAYEDIVVVVKESNINFIPEVGDFVKLSGELQSSDIGDPREGWRYDKKAMIVDAFKIEKTAPPADW